MVVQKVPLKKMHLVAKDVRMGQQAEMVQGRAKNARLEKLEPLVSVLLVQQAFSWINRVGINANTVLKDEMQTRWG